MSDGLMDVIPTVIGGAVALKFIDVAMPDKKARTIYITKKKPAKKKHMTKKEYNRLHKQHYYYSHGKLKKVV